MLKIETAIYTITWGGIIKAQASVMPNIFTAFDTFLLKQTLSPQRKGLVYSKSKFSSIVASY